MKMKYIIGAVALALSFQLQAGLIDQGSYIRDTNSNLNWLKLDSTIGHTLEQVEAAMQAGGIYEGYRLATGAEWESMLADQGFHFHPCSPGDFYCGAQFGVDPLIAANVMNLLGYVPSDTTFYPDNTMMGVLADKDPDTGKNWITSFFIDEFGGEDLAFIDTTFVTEPHEYPYGFWLVDDSNATSVPEPSPLVFSLAAGLFLLRNRLFG